MIAALFVAQNGCYYGLPNVIPYGLPDRDAREYAGPWSVVAHPPCERWGRYAGERAGQDDGCFYSALQSVRVFGGVLEHPACSLAWRAFGLLAPIPGQWSPAGDWTGWVTEVEQGHYGHRARKATWLYAAHCDLPMLKWGPSKATITPRPDRDPIRERRTGAVQRMCHRERAATPLPFRDLLNSIAERVRRTS